MYSVGIPKKIAFEPIHNNKDVDGAVTQSLVVSKATKHEHITVPKNSKWFEGKWKKVFQRGYQQLMCRGDNCKSHIHKVYICNQSVYLYNNCYNKHVLSVESNTIAEK